MCVPQEERTCMNTWNEEPDHTRGWAGGSTASAEGLEADEFHRTFKHTTESRNTSVFPFFHPVPPRLPQGSPRSVCPALTALPGTHSFPSLTPDFSHYK